MISYLRAERLHRTRRRRGVRRGHDRPLREVDGAEVVALDPRAAAQRPARRREVCLRASIDELDVSAIARLSGGGGHRQAAGFSSERSIEEITQFIHDEFAHVPPAGA